MRLTQFSLSNPAAIAAAALIVLLFGGLALFQLLPDTRQPQLFVNVGWREAAPNEVEEALITPIERAMRGLPGLPNAQQCFAWLRWREPDLPGRTDMTRVMLDVVSRLVVRGAESLHDGDAVQIVALS